MTAWRRGTAVAVLLVALAPLPWLVGCAAPGAVAPLRTASAPAAPASPPAPASPAAPAPAAAPLLKSAATWADAFDEEWRATRAQVQGWAASGDSWQQYRLAYSIDALTSAYLATGRAAYVEDGLALLDAVAGSSRPSALIPGSRFHDGYRGWASSLKADGGDEVALYESYLWRYGTGLLRVVREDPALWSRPDLRRSYARLLGVAVRDVFGKWWARGPNSYIYRERVHLSAHWALIAVNLGLLDASRQRRTRYARVIREFVDGSVAERRPGLRTQLVASPFDSQAWFWSDIWGSYWPARPGRLARERRRGVRRRGARPRHRHHRRGHPGIPPDADVDGLGRTGPGGGARRRVGDRHGLVQRRFRQARPLRRRAAGQAGAAPAGERAVLRGPRAQRGDPGLRWPRRRRSAGLPSTAGAAPPRPRAESCQPAGLTLPAVRARRTRAVVVRAVRSPPRRVASVAVTGTCSKAIERTSTGWAPIDSLKIT